MKIWTDTISMKRWQAYILLGLTGFAVGTMLSRLAGAFGV